MLSATNLKTIAQARLEDAQVLFSANRFDGAYYLCGYGVELALKSKICRTLKWLEFPEAKGDYKSLMTHDLDILLHFCGKERFIKKRLLAEWSIVKKWDPELRYKPIGSITRIQAQAMIKAANSLLGVL